MTRDTVGVRGLRGTAELTRLADVRAAAKDWQRFSSRLQGDPDVRDYPQLPLEVDPPEHGRYRALLDPILGRRAIVAHEPAIREIAGGLVAGFAARRTTDAVRDLAIPMVATTIATVFGRPADAAELTSWGLTSWEHLPDGTRSGARLDAYVDRALDAGAGPGVRDGDAFAAIADARLGDRPLTRLEQVGLANLILAGGRDTVIHILLGAMWHLGQDRDARAWLREDVARLQLAIEEYLRYFSPNAGMERRLTEDIAGGWGAPTPATSSSSAGDPRTTIHPHSRRPARSASTGGRTRTSHSAAGSTRASASTSPAWKCASSSRSCSPRCRTGASAPACG